MNGSSLLRLSAPLLLVATSASVSAIDARPVAPPHGPAAASIAPLMLGPGATALQIDGELNEEVWTRAPMVKGFVQRSPDEGAAATYDTEIRIAYDATALYVAVDALDPESGKIVGILTRRDDESPSDWVSIHLDSFYDRRTAFEFGVNAVGVKFDRYWFNDSSNDRGWDAVWDVAVSRHAGGWRAEFRIPLSQLRFSPSTDATFGFAASRTIGRLNEVSTWPLLSRSASGYVSSFADLTGLNVSHGQKKLELTPYVVADLTTAPIDPANPLASSPKGAGNVGVDLKYAIAPGLTLSGTINPDFGQVEADPSVVNLSGFETFFAERRPFFVEGSGRLRFDIDCNDGECTGLFYSRRVGRAPQRVVNASEDGYVDQPSNTTILGAAKVTGRLGKFSIGALNAVTGRESARLVAAPGAPTTRTPVESLTNYSVLRIDREFDNQSSIGVMATATRRSLTEELRFLPETAITGGINGDWRIGRRFSLNGFWAASSVQGSPEAIARLQRSTVHSYQRPDAGHVTYDPTRTDLNGHAGSLSFNKISGQRTRMNVNVGYKSTGFDINDVGFLSRADALTQNVWFQIRDDAPGRFVRAKNINFNQWTGFNLDGDLRYWGGNINSHWTFTNNWTIGTGFNYNGQGFADRLTRGGPGAYTNASLNQWGYIQTDNRRLMYGSLNFSWFADRHDAWQRDLSPTVTIRPSSALLVSLGVGYNRNHSPSQWITNLTQTDGSHYVFGQLNQTTVRLTTRVNYTITPRLSLQVYAQPFMSAGDYSGFKELADGRSKTYDGRFQPFPYTGNPDFNVRSFRTTNVLRWEYRPGSALFVVWQQGRDDFSSRGDFQLGRGVTDLFESPATNTFLIKFSRWMNF